MNTKQRILQEALHLFSMQGFDAVSVAQIAEAVGIKAPSLYKHYASKQDIFTGIIIEMADRYKKQMQGMMMDGTDAQSDAVRYVGISVDQLVMMGKQLFQFYQHDEISSQFRKMLAIEQYHNRALADLYYQQYFEAPLHYQSQIFQSFINQGTMKAVNAEVAAYHFYAPMFLLMTFSDTHANQDKEILIKIEAHIRQFHQLYMKEGGN